MNQFSNEKLNDENLVVVHTVYTELEKNYILQAFENSGIKAVATGQVPKSVFPVNVNGLGEIRIMVEFKDFELAKKIVDDILKSLVVFRKNIEKGL